MRKILCILIAVCLMASVCGCTAKPLPVSPEAAEADAAVPSFIHITLGDPFLEEWAEEDALCRTFWETLYIDAADAEKYPELAKAFERINHEETTQAKSTMYELSSSAKALRPEREGEFQLHSDTRLYLQRADSSLVSWLKAVEVYSGGAHPEQYYTGNNFDPISGKELALTDVLKSIKGLPTMLEKALSDKYDYINFGDDVLWGIFSEYSPDDYQWTIDYQGITFWFSPYDIAAYSAGMLSVKFPFSEIPQLIQEKYITPPSESYALELPMNNEIEFDLTPDDGKLDLICVQEIPDETGSYHMFKTVVNGVEYIDRINYAYSFDAYLIHKNGRNYIYTFSFSDGSYNMFCAIDINDGSADKIDERYATQLHAEYAEDWDESGIICRSVLTDPECFRLSTDIELIGTRTAIAAFRTGDDGMPVMADEAYNIETVHSQLTKVPLEALVLPEEKWETLPVGTELWGLRTDRETYIVMKTQDGREVRFNIDVSSAPHKLNGMPAEDCLDNIMYAG